MLHRIPIADPFETGKQSDETKEDNTKSKKSRYQVLQKK